MENPVICQLSDFGPEYAGSFVDSLLQLARSCRETLRLETLCVFPQRAKGRRWLERFDNDRVKYAFVPAKRNVVFSLRKALANYHPVIFHSHFETFDVTAILLKLGVYRDSKIVWHLHSMARLTVHQRIKDAIKVKLLGRNLGDLFITDGDGVYQNAIDRGLPQEKLLRNHNGVDVARFVPNNDLRQSFRESVGIPNDEMVFLALGRSPLIKGVDLFVKAAEHRIHHGATNDFFLLVGRDETRDFVAGLPESNGLDPRFRILETTDNFPRLLSGIDVFVAPSRTEGFAYAVLEAMAAGKLVVCSDIPGIREIYGNVEGVWLFPPRDWKKLADLMQKAKELSPTEREYLGLLNSQFVTAHYSSEVWAKKIAEIYSNLLNI